MTMHTEHMDKMYRLQRHFYDVTRKPYLLGRDIVIRELGLEDGGTVLEIGCGTARNLLKIAQTYPATRCFGIDVSEQMLETAAKAIDHAHTTSQVAIACADAVSFDPMALFGVPQFDRVVISYALSMIPEWEEVLHASASLLAPTGSLYVVDFGNQQEMPSWFRRALRAWLSWFSVTPREELRDYVAGIAWRHGYEHNFRQVYRGYAAVAEMTAR